MDTNKINRRNIIVIIINGTTFIIMIMISMMNYGVIVRFKVVLAATTMTMFGPTDTSIAVIIYIIIYHH